MKICRDCGQEKPIGDFYLMKGRWPYPRCKACHYIRTQISRAKYIETIRARAREKYHSGYCDRKREQKRQRKYGISPTDYANLLMAQGGMCPICLHPFGPESSTSWLAPSVDHDHETGLVRGILHRRCNLALEFIMSKAELRRARAYLRGKEI